ncbi:hypothetical protein D9M72_578640 [compost metagenome]
MPPQREDQQHGRDQFDEHADAVDPGHQLHAERVDERGNGDHDGGQHHAVHREVVGARAVSDELEAGPQLRQGELEGQCH